MSHCTNKSVLMSILESLPEKQQDSSNNQGLCADVNQMRVDIVDGMAEIQSFKKTDDIKDCAQLADHFTSKLFQKQELCDELRLIFDRYDVPLSLKMATRARRQGLQPVISYRITDSTNISKVTMKKLLSSSSTKLELSCYLAKKTLQKGQSLGKRVIVAWSDKCQGSHEYMNVQHLQSGQEEADTKLILHSVDATRSGATSIYIHSPDTDVLVLALRRYPQLCDNTAFVTGTGQRHRVIPLKPIFEALGEERAAALPGFHAVSGADNTGCFFGKGKMTCWKVFLKSTRDVIAAFSELGVTQNLSETTLAGIEKFVCQLYLQNTDFTHVKEVRWWLFKNKQAQSDSLPPTQSALLEAIKRAHYQALVWGADIVANPVLPQPEGYGWILKENEWSPVRTKLPPAPEAIIHLVKCGCIKTRCFTNQCQCKKANLTCTDLCKCSMLNEEDCENVSFNDDHEETDGFDDEDDFDNDDDGCILYNEDNFS